MGVVGLAENKANSAQLELEAGAELGNDFFCKTNVEAIVVIDVHNISSHFEALKKTFKFGLF